MLTWQHQAELMTFAGGKSCVLELSFWVEGWIAEIKVLICVREWKEEAIWWWFVGCLVGEAENENEIAYHSWNRFNCFLKKFILVLWSIQIFNLVKMFFLCIFFTFSCSFTPPFNLLKTHLLPFIFLKSYNTHFLHFLAPSNPIHSPFTPSKPIHLPLKTHLIYFLPL